MSTHQKLAYSPAEVAAALGLARSTVYAGIEVGTIPSRQVGARKLVPAEWVERFGRDLPRTATEGDT